MMNATLLRVGVLCSVIAVAALLPSACATSSTTDSDEGGSGPTPSGPTGSGPAGSTGSGIAQKGVSRTRTLTGAQVIRNGNYTMVLTLGTHDLNSRTEQGGVR